MRFNPDIHNRRSICLRDYDYSRAGAYFVTICSWQRECLFGEISAGEMRLNDFGSIAFATWIDLPNHYRHIELDAFVVMPNHVHGLIVISDEEARAGLKPAPTDKWHGMSEIVRGFKTFSSRRINESRHNPGCPVWQRDYYDRAIRDGNELTRARAYIVNNPVKWEHDRENPANST
jgi:REP element-mobilizing transposase RayT